MFDQFYIFFAGQKLKLKNPDPSKTLLQFLRNDLGLCGTKLGCGEWGCGACTVMVSHLKNHEMIHNSVNACLAPLCRYLQNTDKNIYLHIPYT